MNNCPIDMKEKWRCSSLTNMGTSTLICQVARNMIHKHNAYEKMSSTKVVSLQRSSKPSWSTI